VAVAAMRVSCWACAQVFASSRALLCVPHAFGMQGCVVRAECIMHAMFADLRLCRDFLLTVSMLVHTLVRIPNGI
jgi:hypothetical protein